MQGKYYVFKQKFAFVNFSLLSQGPHFYVPTCQALHLLQPSSPTLTSRVVLHSISALNQLLNHFVCLFVGKGVHQRWRWQLINQSSMCAAPQQALPFQEKSKAFQFWRSDKRRGQYSGAESSSQHSVKSL